MRLASQRGTCPPCNGKSPLPARCGMGRDGSYRGLSQIGLFMLCTSNAQSLQGAGKAQLWYVALGLKTRLTRSMARSSKQLVVCVKNDGYPASLEKRKLYVMLPDRAAEKHGLLRVIDESGEDYLYPKSFFRSAAPGR
jgi:hypothetical protein